MLSYQHLFHAGNLADVQKHALLAVMLDYLIQKDKPLSYIETHAGRGLYDLGSDEALKTGEAAAGIAIAEAWFPALHPYRNRLNEVRASYGPMAYPGSPLIAALSLRDQDTIHLAELHPQEHQHLRHALNPWSAHIYPKDGFDLALAITPPTPRRGLMLIDPSYEVKADYDAIPKHIANINRKWNVGIIALWYPLLTGGPHGPMLKSLEAQFPDALRSEVRFPPAREGHRMEGSGMFIVNPPYGLSEEAARIEAHFKAL
ncbi:23S rRNA (adenine(2030)-N(6))-methyltransferase RlmJ [Cypionkella sp.]|uniref:23S rRNA (adenine(2030)-N(6))-methyltransferase RlmJ n=1 Tax=Cypionkella sp. TaxID=2811411 RepID=UPI0027292745|nr:23S rRNA (adenine(2030)-N(6))-methyltransferase RlmJ [Cypionkella sp.]MDO8982075.1 23S rRNA (adenine(2030)-N(6))-methyltransferase RlmJ [Cypionkella sp.]MDP2050892.1 23S rRNA (adenine(2030)-N(6))-methyltransferase RlmJ [Cypionkella sp.]